MVKPLGRLLVRFGPAIGRTISEGRAGNQQGQAGQRAATGGACAIVLGAAYEHSVTSLVLQTLNGEVTEP